jgi:hypothetical protein
MFCITRIPVDCAFFKTGFTNAIKNLKTTAITRFLLRVQGVDPELPDEDFNHADWIQVKMMEGI